jgi:hypothetical protein
MKKTSLYTSLAALLFIMTSLLSCSNDDDKGNVNTSDPTPVINTVTQGTWRITSHIEDNLDKTGNYAGYNFTFGTNKMLSATNGTLTATGSWSVVAERDEKDLDFNIGFATPINFVELTDDWDVVSRTDTKIELIDLGDTFGDTDYLTFEKN